MITAVIVAFLAFCLVMGAIFAAAEIGRRDQS